MRSPVRVLFLVASFAATQAAGQDGGPTRLVCLDVDDRALAVEPSPTTSSVRSVRDLAKDRKLTHCWFWNDFCAPQKIMDDERVVAATECDETQRLEVRISDPRRSTAPEETRRRFQVVAAPAEMWREVPRHLLPTTTVDAPALSLPRDGNDWRLQAQAGNDASAWQDVAASQDSVDLALLPATDFRFVVTANSAPLSDSRLSLLRPRQPYPTELLGFEVSDREGIIAITLPTAEPSAVIVTHDSRSAEPFPRLRDIPPTIELGPGLTVSGQVVNEAEEPVEAVRLEGLSFVPDGFGLMQRHRGRTGPEGRFEISGFNPGSASLQTEQGDLAFSRTFDLTGSVDLGSIVLAAPEVAWVRVVDSRDAAPVSGAMIRDSSGRMSNVNKIGLLRLSLAFGRSVFVKAKGYLSTQFELPRRAGLTAEEPHVVGLTPAFSVEGVFVAANGSAPAAGGRAKAASQTTGWIMHVGIAADGSFSLDLPAGAYDLELTAGSIGLLRLDARGVAGEVRNLGAVSAPPSAWVWGYVVDKDDYTPVPGASVSYTRPSEFGPLLAPALGNVVTVTTDAEGYFEMFGLEPGTSTLRVQADGFAPRKLDAEAAAIEAIDVGVVELSRGRHVTVRSDIDKGMVVLDSGRTGLPQDRLTAKLIEGRAAFTTVAEEPFGVMVYEDGDPVCEKYEQDAAGDEVLTCNRTAVKVTGMVTRGEQPAGGLLIWKRRNEAQLPEGGLSYGSGPLARTEDLLSTQTIELRAPLAGDGRYSLRAVLPGEWEVIWTPLSGGTQDVRSVTVPESREAVLDFRYDGVSIEGSVLHPDGQPAPLASVTVFPRRKTVSTDPNGRFQVLGLEVGTHQLRARLRHQRSALVEAELRRPSDREVVQLVLEDDPPNEELVIRVAGGANGFCFVEMDSSLQRVVRIDAGVGRMSPEPPLPDKLRIACHTEGRWILDGWRDLRQALDRGIEFDPFDSNSSIILAGESSPVLVQVMGPGGWDLGQLRVWFDGASTFSAGETIVNLPVGEYVLRWGNQTRTVRTQRRRAAEVELDI